MDHLDAADALRVTLAQLIDAANTQTLYGEPFPRPRIVAHVADGGQSVIGLVWAAADIHNVSARMC